MPSVLLYYASIGVCLWHAARNPRADIRVLGASLLLPALVSFHDLALYLELIPGDTYIGALTSPLGLIGGIVLGRRFERMEERGYSRGDRKSTRLNSSH